MLIEVDYENGDYSIFRPDQYYREWHPESMTNRTHIPLWVWWLWCLHRWQSRLWYNYIQRLGNEIYDRDHGEHTHDDA